MSKARRMSLVITAVAVVGFFLMRWLIQQASALPPNVGVENSRLAPCPDSPNCVSTLADDADQRMEPLPLSGDPAAAMDEIETAVQQMPRAQIITRSDNYLHAEFRSALWGFVDDVEFLLDEDAGFIHFRSAARLGYSDMGVNRSRMEEIQQQLAN